MAWQKLASVSVEGTASTTITASSLAEKKFLNVLCHATPNQTNGDHQWEYHGDSNNNYSNRTSFNGGSDYLQTGINFLRPLGGTANLPLFDISYIINISDVEKLVIGFGFQSNASGSSDAGTRSEYVGKWANTSNQMTEIKAKLRVGSYISNSNITVFGTD
jgi:hypothetical protein